MRSILIFDDTLSGHHLEYLHHLYERALALSDSRFVFAVPEEFKSASGAMDWRGAENISFIFFDSKESKSSFARARLLGGLVRKCGAKEVLLISLMSFLPWLPLFIPAKVRVSGIVYLIYLYRWKTASWKIRILDILKYLLFSRCRAFKRIFLLNDKASARYLNQKFKTKKFEWLPDPVALKNEEKEDLRKKWEIPNDIAIFSHFGAMSERKGTLEILKALAFEECGSGKSLFVFAGKVGNDIRKEFYRLAEIVRREGRDVKIFDEFCSYSFLVNLSRASTAILIPYKSTEQSSGIIAYGALTGTPVFAPCRGLLGRLVERYQLGETVKNVSATGIAEFLSKQGGRMERITGDFYLSENLLSNFQEILLPPQ